MGKKFFLLKRYSRFFEKCNFLTPFLQKVRFRGSRISGILGKFRKISGISEKSGAEKNFEISRNLAKIEDFWRLYPGINQGIKSTKNTLF